MQAFITVEIITQVETPSGRKLAFLDIPEGCRLAGMRLWLDPANMDVAYRVTERRAVLTSPENGRVRTILPMQEVLEDLGDLVRWGGCQDHGDAEDYPEVLEASRNAETDEMVEDLVPVTPLSAWRAIGEDGLEFIWDYGTFKIRWANGTTRAIGIDIFGISGNDPVLSRDTVLACLGAYSTPRFEFDEIDLIKKIEEEPAAQ